MTETTNPAATTETKAPRKHPEGAKATEPGGNGTGNLPLEEARRAVLMALAKGRKSAVELRKNLVPYGNYAALLRGLEADGLIKVVKEGGGKGRFCEATAKGRKLGGK